MDDNLSYLVDRVDDDCANSNAATEDGSPTSSGVELCEVRLYSWQITKKNLHSDIVYPFRMMVKYQGVFCMWTKPARCMTPQLHQRLHVA